MEFLKIVRRRSFLSELVYMGLNIGLAIGILLVVRATDSLIPAFGLVLLSKWRVLAVRPRFWFANIQANLVDFIVSISLVIFLFSVAAAEPNKLIIQSVLTVLYIVWLLFLKPRSKRSYVVAQAGIALFTGTAALFMISYSWPVSVVVAVMWLIGYSTSRHILTNYEEGHVLFLSLLWGLMLAEFGWVAYHWTIAYHLPIIESAQLPQAGLIVLCMGFLVHRIYDSYFHHQKIRTNDIILPLLFTASIALILLIAFNDVRSGSI